MLYGLSLAITVCVFCADAESQKTDNADINNFFISVYYYAKISFFVFIKPPLLIQVATSIFS
jgi:hypothetical protein